MCVAIINFKKKVYRKGKVMCVAIINLKKRYTAREKLHKCTLKLQSKEFTISYINTQIF